MVISDKPRTFNLNTACVSNRHLDSICKVGGMLNIQTTMIHDCRSGDDARILIPSKNEVYQCIVEHVGRDYAVLLITETTKKAW